jgi:putative membrane protein
VHVAAKALIGLVAALHVYFLVLEMFLWNTAYGRKTFKRTAEEQEQTAVLAKNQGLYNGFLAAGLVWSLTLEPSMGLAVARFFLVCVLVAGLYGGATAARTILFAQALPAAIALGATWLAP